MHFIALFSATTILAAAVALGVSAVYYGLAVIGVDLVDVPIAVGLFAASVMGSACFFIIGGLLVRGFYSSASGWTRRYGIGLALMTIGIALIIGFFPLRGEWFADSVMILGGLTGFFGFMCCSGIGLDELNLTSSVAE